MIKPSISFVKRRWSKQGSCKKIIGKSSWNLKPAEKSSYSRHSVQAAGDAIHLGGLLLLELLKMSKGMKITLFGLLSLRDGLIIGLSWRKNARRKLDRLRAGVKMSVKAVAEMALRYVIRDIERRKKHISHLALQAFWPTERPATAWRIQAGSCCTMQSLIYDIGTVWNFKDFHKHVQVFWFCREGWGASTRWMTN